MALEEMVKVEDRTEPNDNAAPERKHPEKCDHCHDNDKKKCKECGCQKCGGKQDPDLQVLKGVFQKDHFLHLNFF